MKNNIRENSNDILKWWFLVRWFIIIILFSISIIRITEVKQITTIIFGAAFLSVVALNVIFYLQVKQKSYLFTSLQIIFDVIFATIVVHITGGLESSFVWIYLVPVITASLTVEALGGMISALIGSLSLLFLIITYKIGWLQPLNNINFEEVIPSELSIFLISYTGLFVSVAVLTSYMKEILKDKNHIKTELNDEVHNLQEEIKSYQNKISEIEDIKAEKNKLLQASLPIAELDHDLNTPLTVISLNIRKIEKAASKFESEKLSDAANDITESINKIKSLLNKVDRLKQNDIIRQAQKSEE